jgi:23S rRNA pseudouridine2605 synthase
MRSKKNIRSTGAPKANTAAKAKFAPKAKHHVKAKPALPPSTNSKQKSTVKVDGIQLNKYISSSGFCSRRQAELYIEEGRVTINDDIAELTQTCASGR